jgi:hypothetical protein
MSVEINVLFHGALPSKAALTRAMKELGFPLTISPPAGSLEKQSGFMPMRLRREETGVEFDVFNGRADIEDMTQDLAVDIDPRFDRSANFRWGGDEREMVCGMCAAAALARLVNGVILDDDGEILTVDEGIAWAKKHLHDATPPDKRGGTRPADIKRYLKALLKERSDLALVGRLLVIKPVRHILRGALFDRTSSRYRFRIWRYVQDLCRPRADIGVGYGDSSFGLWWEVWQPHFEPALMDALAQDVFERVGKLTTFAELAAEFHDSERTSGMELVTMLRLAGERDRAEQCVQQFEKLALAEPYRVKWAEALRWRLEQDINALCVEARACEAKAAKAMMIEHIWEPSPFPVELPAAERTAKSAEPLFVPKPWIARPPWLLQELPEQVGEIRYAKDWLTRNGRRILVTSLSAQQAADRHANGEPYVLATRLPKGLALLLCRDGEDRDDPSRHPGYVCLEGFQIELHSSDSIVRARFSQAADDDRKLKLGQIQVYRRQGSETTWTWISGHQDHDDSIRDYREKPPVAKRNELSDVEMSQLTCPKLSFGEFDTPVAMIMMVLRSKGYGEIT